MIKISEEGKFGATRKYDIHTGIDLICDAGTKIYAIEDGMVVNIEVFTGPNAESPWWNETMAVLVEGESGIICYGEVDPAVEIGQQVKVGDLIGKIMRVLKKDKNKPMSMLHLELYKSGTKNTVWWHIGEGRPNCLLDPSTLKYWTAFKENNNERI